MKKQLISQAAFAKLLGVNRSTVSRYKADGRLVMDGKHVDVEASRQLIKDTSGGRDDVAARHAVDRGQTPEGSADVFLEKRSAAQARKEAAQADIAEMERDQLRGKLVERDAVSAAVADVVITFRQALEGMRRSAAPRLTMQDRDTVKAVLKEETHAILVELEHGFATEIKALTEVPD